MKTKNWIARNVTTPKRSLLLLLSILSVLAQAQSTPFPIATNGPGYFGVSAASDGTNYLVGLQVKATISTVGAQLISSNGAAIGSFMNFGRTGGLPWVASSGTNYLVVWQDDANVKGLKGSWYCQLLAAIALRRKFFCTLLRPI